VVNSLYTKKEIFLRELISNASDAIDKRRFKALTDAAYTLSTPEIRLILDEAAHTLTIQDNGIGMTEEELVANLGTIARSGTREFQSVMAGDKASRDIGQLIGQFGVGFYSAFLVADRVAVVSRAVHSDQAYAWESDAKGTFTVAPAERSEPGTTVTLYLKEEERDYEKPWRLREVVRQHSDYVSHPIVLTSRSEKGEEETDSLNKANALWQRSPKEVTPEQYTEFYKHLAHDWEDPLAHRHFKIEGTQMFAGIVYLPKRSRTDLLDPRAEHGVRLHVRRILAMESCEDLLPKWLRFVKGVVDSEDLPLNVSRETLQDSKAIRIIRKQVVQNVLGMLEDLKKERATDYFTFYKAFGTVLKEGFYFEPEFHERLTDLALFPSTKASDAELDQKDAGAYSTLAEYVERMKTDQPGIYYLESSDLSLARNSPLLERLRHKGFEVLLMVDHVDSFVLEKLTEYQGKKFMNVAQAKLDLGETESKNEETDALTSRFTEVLSGQVGSVRNSDRLSESPACLVTPEGGLPPHMAAMFRAQNLTVPEQKRILELNPDHPLIQNLRKLQLVKADSPELSRFIELVYDQALLAEGSPLDNPRAVANRLSDVLKDLSARSLA
jgi:molecular chaperone HtpG